jgi:phospholipid/cholesterol/gamma-HCH transport system substrate-binding protein
MSAVRVGAFVIAALAIFAAGVFLIGSKEFLFSKTYRLNAAFDSVAGLTDGAEVRVAGIHKGTVRRIDLPSRPDGKVIVEMNLEKPTRDVIKKDSVAAIRAEGLIGDKYVEVAFGSPGAEKVKDGDTIASEPPLEVSALVKKADGILNQMQSAMQDVGKTAGNMDAISAKVNRGAGTLGALVNDRKMFDKANAGLTAFSEDMEALKHNFLLRGFFKNRGYEDAADIGKHEVGRLPGEQPVKTFAYDARKLFNKPDAAKLAHARDLSEAGRFLESGPFGSAVVEVDAGELGDSEKQKQLTRARASVIRDYLVENFKVDDARIQTLGAGKTKSGAGSVQILIFPQAATSSRR